MNNSITLLKGDCIKQMDAIPDNSVDFILTDLPYGLIAPEWDITIDMNSIWSSIKRILSKQGTVAFFACQPFTTDLICSNKKDYRYSWYWIKNQGTNFFHAKHMPIRKIEEICIFKKGKYYPQMTEGHIPTNSAKGCSNGVAYHGKNKRNYEGGSTLRYPTNILEYKCVDNYSRMHPSQKPVDLLEYLIKTYTCEGDVVLDFTMGVGSTGIAAVNTNRKFIGIELDDKYFDIATQRILK